ncbi:ATP-grasp domain-containing protein [Bordetella genomosp. 9]|uniref:ATP-grasp domain-containing protein n=1 Tax=Bordetella genomosp. 9 TaxID=1416803 RepID=UPI0018DF541C|nr:RimK family alpha-L-glutamate ligase [Bordetella genomosp. 9]
MTDTTAASAPSPSADAPAPPGGARTQYPDLIGKARLITLAFQQGDLEGLRQQLLARAQRDPGDANAALDLSMTLLLLGQRDTALALQRHAVQAQPLYHMPAMAQPAGLRLLALVSCGDFLANTPLEFLIADSDVDLHLLYVGDGIPMPASLPDHDAMIVAVGESSANRPLLQALAAPLAQWHRPVLNRPEAVLKTSRDGLRGALAGAEGVVSPDIARVARATLETMASGGITPADVLPGVDFPVLVRPVDSHAGNGLARMEHARDLEDYLAAAEGDDFYLSRFVEYRGADGRYRKYRVVLIDGKPFLGHLGISPRWMVHYLNADMAANADNRAEEAEQMRTFDTGFAARHAQAFAEIHRRVGLDYFVMDCAETQDGRLLVFEGDTCGVVHAMDPEDLYPYKPAYMRRIFAAFQAMLKRRAGTPTAA